MSMETEKLRCTLGIQMLCTRVTLYGYLKRICGSCELLPPVDLEGWHKQKLNGDLEL